MNQIQQNISAPELDWLAALKKTQVKLDILTDNDMLLMVEKCIRGKYALQFITEGYDENKESSYLQ